MIVLFTLLALCAGIAVGVVTGLLPGLHVNVVAALLVATVATTNTATWGVPAAVFVVAVSVTHAFFDYVPSLFLGVPGAEVYALLPGQKMIRAGRGAEALALAVWGTWGGLLGGFAVAALLLVLSLSGLDLLRWAERALQPWLFWVLAVICVVLVLSERRRGWAALLFVCSGLLGVVVLGSPLIPGGTSGPFSAILPALTGLFGLSGLLLTLFESSGQLPEQRDEADFHLPPAQRLQATALGGGLGMLVGLLPGLGAANAATLALLGGQRGETEQADRRYIVLTSAIQATDTLFGIAALYFIGKSRSGASVAIEALSPGLGAGLTFVLLAAMLVAGALSRRLLLAWWKPLVRRVAAVPYRPLNLAVAVFVTGLVLVGTGGWGLLILGCATMLGLLPAMVNVRRAQLMGFFLVPVLLFFSGRQAEIVTALGLQARTSPPVPFDVGTLLVQGAALLAAAGVAFVMAMALGRWQQARTAGRS